MKAGRELDALIAEKVMGLDVRLTPDPWPDMNEPDYLIYEDNEPVLVNFVWEFYQHCPHYSTQIADAWQVVEKVAEKNAICCFHIKIDVVGPCIDVDYAAPDKDHTWHFLDVSYPINDAPLAICLAALKAVGYEISS